VSLRGEYGNRRSGEVIRCDECKGTGVKPNSHPPELCKKCQGKLMLDWIENVTGAYKMTKKEKNIIYCVKVLNELVDMGILSGKAFNISDYGLKIIENFEPEEGEMEEALNLLKQQGYFG